MVDTVANAGMQQLLEAGLAAGKPVGNLSQVPSILDGMGANAQAMQGLPPELLEALPPELLAMLGINPAQLNQTKTPSNIGGGTVPDLSVLLPQALTPQAAL